MSGILNNLNEVRNQSLNKMGYLSNLEKNRNNNNDAISAQDSANKKQALGSGLGMMATSALTGNPIGMAVGGLSILGSLF